MATPHPLPNADEVGGSRSLRATPVSHIASLVRGAGNGVPVWWLLLLGVVLIAEGLLLALIPYFVTVDGAAHVAGAAALEALLFQPRELIASQLTLTWLPLTNLLPALPQAIATAVIGPEVAEKLVLAVYAFGSALAMLYAVTSVRRGSAWLAAFVLPLTFTIALHYGLYSFVYGTVAFLVVAGYHARHSAKLGRREVIVLSGLLTLTYACHAFVFLMALLLVATVELWGWLTGPPRTLGGLAARVLRVAIVGLPGLGLSLTIAVEQQGPASGGGGIFALQPLAAAETLTLVHPLVSFDQREALPAVFLATLLWGLVLGVSRFRSHRFVLEPQDGYAAYAVMLVLLILVLNPAAALSSGGPGGLISERLSLLFVYVSVLWLAGHSLFSSRVKHLTVAACVAAALGLFAVRLPVYLQLSRHAESFAALAPCVAPNSTFAQTNLARVPTPSRRTDPITQETGRISSLTRGWDLLNLEPILRIYPYRSQSHVDPRQLLRRPGGWPETSNPVIDPLQYEAATGQTVDYILVFGRLHSTGQILESVAWQRLSGQLNEAYRLVITSDDGWLELHERTESSAAEVGSAVRDASAACPPRPESERR